MPVSWWFLSHLPKWREILLFRHPISLTFLKTLLKEKKLALKGFRNTAAIMRCFITDTNLGMWTPVRLPLSACFIVVFPLEADG